MSFPNARCLASALVFALALCLTVSPLQAIPARAEVVGTTYTSPQFGFTVTWDESWVVTDETSAEFDRIVVTNGIGFAQFIGADAFGENTQVTVVLGIGGTRSDTHVSNYQELPASDGI